MCGRVYFREFWSPEASINFSYKGPSANERPTSTKYEDSLRQQQCDLSICRLKRPTTTAEQRERGAVSSAVYWSYITAAGGARLILGLCCVQAGWQHL